LSQAIGVALAAAVLYLMQRRGGSTAVVTADVAPAFILIGTLSLTSLLFFARLPANAAAEVSGHRWRQQSK
jgi:hypothetical protein